ncbi:hypothetical protein FOA52_015617 [Chlamydomonas sp. UWO 241]|nr:hypothetical protein FOA52_015617 [Chlamydomonas sp. UWO 241]
MQELRKLVCLLPDSVRTVLETRSDLLLLVEVVMDLGRPPLARFPGGEVALSKDVITDADLSQAVELVGDFDTDNRAGINHTLHRISCMRARSGRIVGLTCRVGRVIEGSAAMVEDLVRAGRNILLLGRPGVGKTTAIRDISCMLADAMAKRTVIVDTSNEIDALRALSAGQADIRRLVGGLLDREARARAQPQNAPTQVGAPQVADAGHSGALAGVLAVVQAQAQQIASLVDVVSLLVSRVPGAPMQMPHAEPARARAGHAAHSAAPRAAPAAEAAQPARPAAAAAPVASAAGAPAAERPAAAGAARAASARGPSRRGGLPARVGETSLCRSHVLSIPVAAATRLIAGRGSEGQMARDGIVRGALRDASYLGSTRHVRRLFSDCYGSEETAVAAAAVRVAAAAVDGVSLPVCLAMNLVRFVHDVSGRDRPAGGGVVSASFLNAKPAVGGIGVEPRRGGVLRVLFTVASDAVADTVVRSRRNLRDVDPSAAVFDVLSDREEAQHRALWPAFLAAKAAGKRAQFHRARLVVDGERVPAPAC